MPTPVMLALLILILPLGAFAIEILHALFTRRMPGWSDKLSTGAMFMSLGMSLYLLATEVLGHEHGIEHAHAWSVPWMSFGGTTRSSWRSPCWSTISRS